MHNTNWRKQDNDEDSSRYLEQIPLIELNLPFKNSLLKRTKFPYERNVSFKKKYGKMERTYELEEKSKLYDVYHGSLDILKSFNVNEFLNSSFDLLPNDGDESYSLSLIEVALEGYNNYKEIHKETAEYILKVVFYLVKNGCKVPDNYKTFPLEFNLTIDKALYQRNLEIKEREVSSNNIISLLFYTKNQLSLSQNRGNEINYSESSFKAIAYAKNNALLKAWAEQTKAYSLYIMREYRADCLEDSNLQISFLEKNSANYRILTTSSLNTKNFIAFQSLVEDQIQFNQSSGELVNINNILTYFKKYINESLAGEITHWERWMAFALNFLHSFSERLLNLSDNELNNPEKSEAILLIELYKLKTFMLMELVYPSTRIEPILKNPINSRLYKQVNLFINSLKQKTSPGIRNLIQQIIESRKSPQANLSVIEDTSNKQIEVSVSQIQPLVSEWEIIAEQIELEYDKKKHLFTFFGMKSETIKNSALNLRNLHTQARNIFQPENNGESMPSGIAASFMPTK